MPEPAPFLDEERLLRLLSPAAALEAVRGFFSAHGREQVEVPPRIHLNVPGRDTVGLYMPAATSRFLAVKIVHLMPERRPAVEAEVFLYDAETGRLLFWGDGKPLTALRTAAVSAAAALRLLPRCERLVVFGAGVQAAAHVAAFASAYPELAEVRAVTRGAESTRRLLAQLPAALRKMVGESTHPAADLARCDCVVTTTPAPEPLFSWADLPAACHIAAIGSATPEMNEIPAQAFLNSEVWVDTPVALQEAGDCMAAKAQGWDEASLRGDLFDLLGGAAPPSLPDEDGAAAAGRRAMSNPTMFKRTMFKSVGHAAQDLAILIHLWELLQAGK